MRPQEDGQKFWVHIFKIVDYHEAKSAQYPGHTQSICYVNDDQYEKIMSYNDIINHIKNQEDEDIGGRFKCIVAHKTTLNNSHTNYKVSNYNAIYEWGKWYNTTNTLSIIAAYDPVTCAMYAEEKFLLQQEGWKNSN